MLFNSLDFLFFIIVFFGIYFIIPHRFKWVFLLISSYIFYMSWNVNYIFLIILFTLLNYYCARKIQSSRDDNKRTIYLISSITGSLFLLFIFKYYNFFLDSIYFSFSLFNLNLNLFYSELLLPLGISFYTLQTIGYVIDVYNGKFKAERNYGIFSLYVSFFPQLVAGPIERSYNLIPQLKRKNVFTYKNFILGVKSIILGFFLKLVIADRIAPMVNIAFAFPNEVKGEILLSSLYLFSFQIFCDFAGYSLIAIGLAKIIGIDLMINFRRPYFSQSITEFWRRWHISLSSWFKDYVYIPLGGNKVKVSRIYVNLMIVFIISGIWHGAQWTFLIWGFIHGLFIISEKGLILIRERLGFIRSKKDSILRKIVKILLTYHLVLFSWIFFRAENLPNAMEIVSNILNFTSHYKLFNFFDKYDLFLCIFFIFFILVFQFLNEIGFLEKTFKKYPLIEFIGYNIILFLILIFGVFESNKFIYFQF